jgi:hypothetical protein
VKRTHAAALAALVVLATPALAGCFNGQQATTSTQATMNSGNSVEATQGAIQIDGTTVVLGPEGSGTATLVVRFTNTGVDPDRLTFATINGVQATIVQPTGSAGEPGEMGPGVAVAYGYDSDGRIDAAGVDLTVSTYVPVELGFQNAGLATLSVMVVPPTGYYEGITPAL